jgi:hypothetical protein
MNKNSFALSTDDFFSDLKENYADISGGYAIFTLHNPTPLSLSFNALNFNFRIQNNATPTYDFKIYREKSIFYSENVTNYGNPKCSFDGNQTTCQENITGWHWNNYTQKEFRPLDAIENVRANEDVTIKIESSWKPTLGKNFRDWIPYVIVNSVRYEKTAWQWWNTSWTGKIPINVTLSTGSISQNPYHVRLNVTYNSSMMPNGEDLRFLNSTENFPATNSGLWYYIVNNKTSSWFLIDVRMEEMPINTTNRTMLWLYFGNTSYVNNNPNNGTRTYFAFSDIESGSVSSANYDFWRRSYGSGTLSAYQGNGRSAFGKWEMNISSDANTHVMKNLTIDQSSRNRSIVSELWINLSTLTGTGDNNYIMIGNWTPGSPTSINAPLLFDYTTDDIYYYCGVSWVASTQMLAINKWYKTLIYVNQTGYIQYLNVSNSTWSWQVQCPNLANTVENVTCGAIIKNTRKTYFDQCIVRSWNKPEPIVTFGVPQGQTTAGTVYNATFNVNSKGGLNNYLGTFGFVRFSNINSKQQMNFSKTATVTRFNNINSKQKMDLFKAFMLQTFLNIAEKGSNQFAKALVLNRFSNINSKGNLNFTRMISLIDFFNPKSKGSANFSKLFSFIRFYNSASKGNVSLSRMISLSRILNVNEEQLVQFIGNLPFTIFERLFSIPAGMFFNYLVYIRKWSEVRPYDVCSILQQIGDSRAYLCVYDTGEWKILIKGL